jgi:nitrous oxidase accessory protein NosD
MATTAELLAEARTALHALATGQSAVEVRDSDGSSVRFTPGNMSRLKTYIAELEATLAGKPQIRKPFRPVFS